MWTCVSGYLSAVETCDSLVHVASVGSGKGAPDHELE